MSFEERSTQSGGFTFGARGSGHDDYVALLLTASMSDAERMVPGSPNRRRTMTEALLGLVESERVAKLYAAAGVPAPE